MLDLKHEGTPMRVLMFNFRPEISPERQTAVLKRISRWSTINKASRLMAKATRSAVRQMCYAYVVDTADVDGLRERLAGLPEVESAAIPADRQLV